MCVFQFSSFNRLLASFVTSSSQPSFVGGEPNVQVHPPLNFLARGSQVFVYDDGSHVVKVPYFEMGMNRSTLALFRRRVFGKTGEVSQTQDLGVQATLQSYRLASGALDGLVVPYDILDGAGFVFPDKFRKRGRYLDILDTQYVIRQDKSSFTFGEKLNDLWLRGDYPQCHLLMEKALTLHEGVWRRGIADLDLGINIFDNFEYSETGRGRLIDVGNISDRRQDLDLFITETNRSSQRLLSLLAQGYPLVCVLERLQLSSDPEDMKAWAQFQHLPSRLPDRGIEKLGHFFLSTLIKIFDPSNVERNWKSRTSS